MNEEGVVVRSVVEQQLHLYLLKRVERTQNSSRETTHPENGKSVRGAQQTQYLYIYTSSIHHLYIIYRVPASRYLQSTRREAERERERCF